MLQQLSPATPVFDDLRRRATGAASLEESRRQLESVREAERVEAARLPDLDKLAVEVLNLFESHRIGDLIVVDKQHHPVGLVDAQDLAKVKLL